MAGRVICNDSLIVDEAGNVHDLEEKLKLLLFEFENVEPEMVVFEYFYDIYALFQEVDFLNIGKVAQRAGINAGLMRQYASQVKYTPATQARKIEASQ
ncbi:hypothetical protein [Pedobacter sp. FW305-3-2-15-E-R2A2]|uniref:hypothetical protein n=1 Tax=Pedobacter sp. FW305-3-2-15-E-R2A2 TaxID=3140251 RepID=UPI00313FF7B2